MKLTLLLLGCLLVAGPLARADEAEVDETHVKVLTDKNFADTMKTAKFALVEFYAPWCGHCKSLKAPYAEAATELKDLDNVILAKVDATEEKETAGKFEIKGYPTLKWFVDGEMASDYNGGRTAPEIVAWIKKRTGPATVELTSVAELDKVKEDGLAFYAYFSKFEGDAHTAFETMATKVDDISFFKTSDAAVAKALGLSKADSFAFGRNYPTWGTEIAVSDGHEAFKGDDELEVKLTSFMRAEKLPAFVEFSQAMAPRIFGAGIDHQVIIVGPADAFAEGSAFRKDLTAASMATKGKVVWVVAKTDDAAAEPIINFFSFDKEKKDPQIAGFMASVGKKYAFTADKLNAKTLETFGAAVADGTATKRRVSDALPEEPTDEGVTVIVGDNFDEIVKDPTKDVLLEVYAPWCGHCKALAPVYSKLAKRFKSVDSVVIAKMDGTKNEVPDVDVTGFPTIVFFPAKEGAVAITYDQPGRELKDLTKFIKKHAATDYELPKKAEKADAEEDKAEDDKADEAHDEL